MRNAEISNEQIIEAGKAMQSAGRDVTAFGLRTQIGGGNAKRLGEVWRQYVSEASTTQPEASMPLPAEVEHSFQNLTTDLSERLKIVATELNTLAVKTAEQRVADALRLARQKSEKAERDMAEAIQVVEGLEEELEGSKDACQALVVQIATLKEDLSKMHNENSRLCGQLEATKLHQDAIMSKLQQLGEATTVCG